MFVLVLVLHQTVIELLLDVWEDEEHLVEVLMTDHAYRRVVLCLDCRCALGTSQQCNLAKVLTWADRAHEPLLPVLVLDEALALALCNDEEVVVFLALLDLYLLRLAHHELNLRDHVVLHVRVEREDQVLFELLREDEPGHFLFERGTDHLEEFSKLVLMVQGLLDVLKVRDDSVLDLLG